MHGTNQDVGYIYILLSFLQGGELYTLIHGFDGGVMTPLNQLQGAAGASRTNAGLPQPAACFYAQCMVQMLEFLHLSNIAYRDLKPENLMVSEEAELVVLSCVVSVERVEG